jgi:hypothetical protein
MNVTGDLYVCNCWWIVFGVWSYLCVFFECEVVCFFVAPCVYCVVWSNPLTASIAQLGERQTEDLKVLGSIPSRSIAIFFLPQHTQNQPALQPTATPFQRFSVIYNSSPCVNYPQSDTDCMLILCLLFLLYHLHNNEMGNPFIDCSQYRTRIRYFA